MPKKEKKKKSWEERQRRLKRLSGKETKRSCAREGIWKTIEEVLKAWEGSSA